MSQVEPAPASFDVAIVGAGFAGMYMLLKTRELGLSARVFETGTGVGGTWYWNRYPGARVDVESREYSYSFSAELEHEWRWSERYAAQPELLRYANHVADRFDLRRDIQFETRITAMVFDEATNRWTLTSGTGDQVVARYCVMATGCLSMPKEIDLPGIGDFEGAVYRTNLWPKEDVDFTGQRVAIIGTGSSGVQSIPVIAGRAAHLTVFQRTPSFSFPSHNAPMDEATRDDWLENRVAYRNAARATPFGSAFVLAPDRSVRDVSDEERSRIYDEYWVDGGLRIYGSFNDLLTDRDANRTLVDYLHGQIRTIVEDPEVAAKLCPTTYPCMTKRPCIDTGYFETFNRDNVELVDIRAEPIAITAAGVRTGGKERAFDSIVLAIGFDAMTGALSSIDIRGRGGVRLKDEWHGGPRTYLGLAIAGFPNMFIVTGPGSPSVLSNMIISIEDHVEWIARCLAFLCERGLDGIEVRPEAQEAWVRHVNEVADMTLFPLADSWYVGANVPGKARVFMPYVGGIQAYRQKCGEVEANDYQGFEVWPAATAG